jgi:hypothetical protein
MKAAPSLRPAAAAVLLLTLLLAAALTAGADEEGVRVMYQSSGSPGYPWARSLAAALARSPRLDAVIAVPEGSELAEASARLLCSLAIEVDSVVPDQGDARSSWRIIDPLTGLDLAAGVIEGLRPTERDLAEFWWIPLTTAAEEALGRVAKTLVRIEGQPGTVITGRTGKDRGGLAEGVLVIPDTGFIEAPLRVPGTYPWRATTAGAYPESGYFGALEQGAVLTIPYRPIRRWTIEAGMAMLQFPELWVHWSLRNDDFYLRAGFAQYLLGLYLVREEYELESQPVILSLPMVLPGIGAGAYFMPPDAFVRPYLSAGAFARLMVMEEAFGLDPAAPFGLSLAAGAEWRAFPRVAIFVDMGLAWYPVADGFLMAASRGTDDRGPMMFIDFDSSFLEFPMLRVGARIRL